MDLAALRDEVGATRFDAACDWAWKTAENTGSNDLAVEWPEDLGMVPHEMDDYWWGDALTPSQKLDLALDVYRAMPCYWNGALLYNHRDQLRGADRSRLWSEIRGFMCDDDDRLADPMGYCLWVEWFEDRDTQAEAWREVAVCAPSDACLRRLLPLSGPVGYALKRDLYWRLVNEGHRWDRLVGTALVASTFDVYGQIDERDALLLCARIVGLERVDGADQMIERLRGRRSPRQWYRRT